MFKKVKKYRDEKLTGRQEYYIEATCVRLLINNILIIDRKLAKIECDIEKLKHDKDATLFSIVIDTMKSVEKELENIKDETCYEATKGYVGSATSRLEQIKKDIQLILYGVKFG